MLILTLDDSWVNSLQEESIAKMLATCRHGAARIDVTMRVDGREFTFEADWIKHMNQGRAPHVRGDFATNQSAQNNV